MPGAPACPAPGPSPRAGRGPTPVAAGASQPASQPATRQGWGRQEFQCRYPPRRDSRGRPQDGQPAGPAGPAAGARPPSLLPPRLPRLRQSGADRWPGARAHRHDRGHGAPQPRLCQPPQSQPLDSGVATCRLHRSYPGQPLFCRPAFFEPRLAENPAAPVSARGHRRRQWAGQGNCLRPGISGSPDRGAGVGPGAGALRRHRPDAARLWTHRGPGGRPSAPAGGSGAALAAGLA